MTFEFNDSELISVAGNLERFSESVTEIYPSQRDTLLVASAMLRSSARLRRLAAQREALLEAMHTINRAAQVPTTNLEGIRLFAKAAIANAEDA